MSDEVFPRTVITSDRLRLRPFEASDVPEVHAAWHEERFVSTAPVGYPYANAGLKTAFEWCTLGTEKHRLDGKGVSFAVEPREGGRLIGHVALFDADWTSRNAEIHYWTAAWARGNGYAAEAANAVATWALRDIAYERISLHAATANSASRHVADSAGFQFEGTLRNFAPTRSGTRTDLAVYSLIKQDLRPAAG
ncbi:GNAT family N-acetyltransferase [Paractinoplanes durhamensis]|uniref:Acetyltransferase n=1 Tax=Paractinoplanes durhamensis TaxID=113563 RepID=A0ABQ3YTV5_9ACTN|nr:GNAT family protein [Actinoplanes durhamensis]GIE01040.1 acetyltransferase [Actinoplanes durhamensis]